MQKVTIAKIIEEIKRRLGEMPKKRYLIAAAVLAVLLALGEVLGGPEALHDLCNQIVADLGQIQPFAMIGRYFEHYGDCDMSSTFAGDVVNCSPLRFLDPRRFLGALLTTLGDTWSESGVPGRIILPLALVATFPVALWAVWGQVRKWFGETPTYYISICLAALMTPIFASVVALILQGLAVLFFTLFGAIFGLLAWFSTVFGGVWALWKMVKEIKETAEKMENVATAVATVVTVKPTEPTKPGHSQ